VGATGTQRLSGPLLRRRRRQRAAPQARTTGWARRDPPVRQRPARSGWPGIRKCRRNARRDSWTKNNQQGNSPPVWSAQAPTTAAIRLEETVLTP
jgi:hypothetical protein